MATMAKARSILVEELNDSCSFATITRTSSPPRGRLKDSTKIATCKLCIPRKQWMLFYMKLSSFVPQHTCKLCTFDHIEATILGLNLWYSLTFCADKYIAISGNLYAHYLLDFLAIYRCLFQLILFFSK